MLVVGFTGSHCTGKTTTATICENMLKRKGYRVYLIKKVVRNLDRNELGTIKAQMKIHKMMCDELIKAYKSMYDVVITDRTPLDVAYYTLYYLIKHEWDETSLRLAQKLIQSNISVTKSLYDLIILMDGIDTIPIVDDGFRLTDNHSRLCIDIIARIILRTLPDDIPVYVVKPKSPEETAKEVVYVIEKMLKKYECELSNE